MTTQYSQLRVRCTKHLFVYTFTALIKCVYTKIRLQSVNKEHTYLLNFTVEILTLSVLLPDSLFTGAMFPFILAIVITGSGFDDIQSFADLSSLDVMSHWPS